MGYPELGTKSLSYEANLTVAVEYDIDKDVDCVYIFAKVGGTRLALRPEWHFVEEGERAAPVAMIARSAGSVTFVDQRSKLKALQAELDKERERSAWLTWCLENFVGKQPPTLSQ